MPPGPDFPHLIPLAERLGPSLVYQHSLPVVRWALAALIVACLLGVPAALAGLIRKDRTLVDRAERLLAGLVVTAPLTGAAMAFYELMKAAIGLANFRPPPTLPMLAPALAEAGMTLWLGFLVAACAMLGRTLALTFRRIST